MSKTNSFETAFLNHVFTNAAIANIGDASGLPAAATPGSLYIALYTTDPGEAGGGTEASFGGYARQAVARGSGWTVLGNKAENAAAITFPEATSGSETVTHFAILTDSSGGDMLYYSSLTASRAVATGVTLEFAAGVLTITED